MKTDDQLIGSAEAAKLLGITRSTLYQWTSERKIPFIKISRNMIKFDPQALRAWIEAKRVEAIGGGARKTRPPRAVDGGSPRAQEGRREAETGPTSHKPGHNAPKKPARKALGGQPKERKVRGIKKAIEYRARMQIKEKERRLKQARQKAAEDAIGKPEVYE